MQLGEVRIVDITKSRKYKKQLHRCLGGPPSRFNKRRIQYLKKAIPKGFHKKLLIFEGDIVGTIEYSPSDVSYYPIVGNDVTVMNCIWVLRRAKGHNFGEMLIGDMVKSERGASGFAAVALTGHWSPWFKREQMEKLGFKPLESMSIAHKTKHKESAFKIHLMWMPVTENAQPPLWDQQQLLEGITACTAHPLYHPQSYKPTQIFQKYPS